MVSIQTGLDFYEKAETYISEDPALRDIDHGYNNQLLPDHASDPRIGYFGGGISGITLTFGWVLLVNTFIRNL
jgi:hypothetical protein